MLADDHLEHRLVGEPTPRTLAPEGGDERRLQQQRRAHQARRARALRHTARICMLLAGRARPPATGLAIGSRRSALALKSRAARPALRERRSAGGNPLPPTRRRAISSGAGRQAAAGGRLKIPNEIKLTIMRGG